jgi:membrane protease YdiL (CAAX protease family)
MWRRAAVLAVFALLVGLGPRPAGAQPVPALEGEARGFALSLSQSPADRIQAADLLARGGYAAMDRLRLLLTADRDPAVRAAAAAAFARSGNPYYQPLLEMAAEGDPDPAVRSAARRAADTLWAFSRSPRLAAGFSLLCPGCGYFHLRQPGRAGLYLASTAALVGAGLALAAGEEIRLDGPGPRMTPTTTPLAIPALAAAQNLWLYGVFASYRDARLLRGDAGYRYPVSPEGLTELVTAPVRPSVLRRPWFWAGLPLMLGAAVSFTLLIAPDDLGEDVRSLTDGGGVWFLGRHYRTGPGVLLGEAYYAGLFLPVGVGEEALFRGALQPALTEWLGLWPGWAVTSVIFGGVHLFNFVGEPGGLATAAAAVPFLTLVGSYMGLTAIQTGFRLETSVALHFWYDFLISTISFVADPDHQPFALRLGMPF